jgi:hypothetical protein
VEKEKHLSENAIATTGIVIVFAWMVLVHLCMKVLFDKESDNG